MSKTFEFFCWGIIVPLIILIVIDRFIPGSKDLVIGAVIWIIIQVINAIFDLTGEFFATIFGNRFVQRSDLMLLLGAGLLIWGLVLFSKQVGKK